MKDNKLIAEFMGYRLFGTKCRKPNLMYNLNDDLAPMQFHTSWDWLIPVVNKIEMECEGVPIQLIDVSFYDEIHEVYWAVVEFIKTYNDEKN